MVVVGVTGGIGSGKGLASDFLRSRGAAIIDADEVARQLTQPGSRLVAEIASALGPQFVREDGALDRRKLARAVFSDPQSVSKLNAIMHPPIMEEIQQRLAQLRRERSHAIVCVVAPLLLEAGGRGTVDRVLVMAAQQEERVRRVMARDNLTEEEVRLRMAAQMSLEQQRRSADWVVDTTAGREAAVQQLEEVWAELKTLASASN